MPEPTNALLVDPHPTLAIAAFETRFQGPLGEVATGAAIRQYFDLAAEAPLERSEEVRAAVRDLLRSGGYKPTGRGKPSAEYLVRAAGEAALAPINAAVDACNAVSLHSGLPISVVDLDRVEAPLRVKTAGEGESYVFNPSGQEINLAGLLCLYDTEGPCANAVKDSQRTKTSESTLRTLSVVWASRDLGERLERAATWYRGLLEELGARTVPWALQSP